MLPGLERLSLGDATAGFYELTAAEQQRVADEGTADPITLDNPTHVMTFRVQMDTPNPDDGTPRYAYYSPASLWGWVRQAISNGKLPHNPSQKILYDDFMRLFSNYGGHGDMPHWEVRVPSSQVAATPRDVRTRKEKRTAQRLAAGRPSVCYLE